MNTYSFNDCQKGMRKAFEVEITEEKMKDFMELTEDVNPLHTDREFAVKKGFAGRVAYGHLTASFFSTLGGGVSPGRKLSDTGSQL